MERLSSSNLDFNLDQTVLNIYLHMDHQTTFQFIPNHQKKILARSKAEPCSRMLLFSNINYIEEMY